MLKFSLQKAEKIISNSLQNMSKLRLIFSLLKSRFQDNQISIMLRLNRLKKWAKSWIMLLLIKKKCLRNQNSKYFNIKMKLIRESRKFKS